MGNNYYLEKKRPPRRSDPIFSIFNIADEGYSIHVGKSSCGWRFLFQGKHVKTWDVWKETLRLAVKCGWKFVDEYGREEALHEFIEFVEMKQKFKSHTTGRDEDWLDPEGYNFCSTEFF